MEVKANEVFISFECNEDGCENEKYEITLDHLLYNGAPICMVGHDMEHTKVEIVKN